MNGKLMYKNALICFIGNCQQSDQTVNSYTLQERRGEDGGLSVSVQLTNSWSNNYTITVR